MGSGRAAALAVCALGVAPGVICISSCGVPNSGVATEQSPAVVRVGGQSPTTVTTPADIRVEGPADTIAPVTNANRGVSGGTLFWAFALYLVVSKTTNVLHDYVRARRRARRPNND